MIPFDIYFKCRVDMDVICHIKVQVKWLHSEFDITSYNNALVKKKGRFGILSKYDDFYLCLKKMSKI